MQKNGVNRHKYAEIVIWRRNFAEKTEEIDKKCVKFVIWRRNHAEIVKEIVIFGESGVQKSIWLELIA